MMDLLSMLKAANNPRPHNPCPVPLSERQRSNLALGGKAQTAYAIERYREIMEGRGWMTQRQIENALGYASTIANPFLHKLLGWGKVERRNKGGAPEYSQRHGREWRWL